LLSDPRKADQSKHSAKHGIHPKSSWHWLQYPLFTHHIGTDNYHRGKMIIIPYLILLGADIFNAG